MEKVQLPAFLVADLYKNHLVITNDIIQDGKLEKDTTLPAQPISQVATISNTTSTQPEKTEVKIPTNVVTENRFLGNNAKKITILVRDETAVFVREEWLNTLTKLLAALKFNLQDVAIVNLHSNATTFNALQKTLEPVFVLMFDVTTSQIQLPFSLPLYQVLPYQSCTFIQASSITLINNTQDINIKTEKMQLWQALKKVFP